MVLGPLTDLAVIVVTYNSASVIEECLYSVRKFVGDDAYVTVVDNASTDSTKIKLAAMGEGWPNLRLVQLNENIGFGAANNRGFEEIDARWYLLLNADARLTDSSILGVIADAAEDDGIAICGLPLVFPDGSPQTYAYSFSSWQKWLLQILGFRRLTDLLSRSDRLRALLERIPMARGLVRSNARGIHNFIVSDFPKSRARIVFEDVDWVCGAAMIIRGNFLRKYGGFDPKIFLYGEDEDLCLAATRAGLRVVAADTGVVTHIFGWGDNKANPTIARLKYDSLKYFINKNIPNRIQRFLMRMLLPLHVYGICGGFRANH